MRRLLIALSFAFFASTSFAQEKQSTAFDDKWSWAVGFQGVSNQGGIHVMVQTPVHNADKLTYAFRATFNGFEYQEFNPTVSSGNWSEKYYGAGQIGAVLWGFAPTENTRLYSTMNWNFFSNGSGFDVGPGVEHHFGLPNGKYHTAYIEASLLMPYSVPADTARTALFSGLLFRTGTRWYF
jgi:hypothetical protein